MSIALPRRCSMEFLETRELLAVDIKSVEELQGDTGRDFYVADDHLFFMTGTPDANSSKLWASDGTSDGTFVIPLELNHVVRERDVFRSISGSKFYFVTQLPGGAGNDRKLRVSEGTIESTHTLETPFLTFVRAHGDLTFLVVADGGNDVPWITDGTQLGTKSLVPVDGPQLRYTYPSALLEGVIYFTGAHQDGDLLKRSIWKTDGTAEGTQIAVTHPEAWNPSFAESGVFAGKLYFSASTQRDGTDLWVTDGSQAGTYALKDLQSTTSSGAVYDFVATENCLFFTVKDSDGVAHLWRTDGTADGTFPLDAPRIVGGGNTVEPNSVVVDDIFYFAAVSDLRTTLWRTDGTNEGTYQLTTVSMPPAEIVNCNGTIFMGTSSRDGTIGFLDEDGLETVPVSTYRSSTSRRPNLACMNSNLYFNGRVEGMVHYGIVALTPPPGDTNFDGLVDLTDLNNVRNNFGRTGNSFAGDVTGDELVGLEDLNEVQNHFGGGATDANGATSVRSTFAAMVDFVKSNQQNRARDFVFDMIARSGASIAIASPKFAQTMDIRRMVQ